MATYNDTNGSIINVLTKAQYDSITKNDNELYFVTDENNLLSPATTFSLGAVKIGSGLNIDSTGLLSVQSPLDVNISGHAASATTADKATKDSDGNTITSTYVKKAGDTMTGTLNGYRFLANQTTSERQVGISYSDGTTSGNLYLWGNGSTGTAGLYDSNSGYILRKNAADNTYTFYGTVNTSKDVSVASFRTTEGAANYVLIKINSSQLNWMSAFTVRVYQNYQVYDVTFSGYQYGSNYWYSPKATLGSDSSVTNLTVYFGYNSTTEMWVALPGAPYTGAKVINVVNGYKLLDIPNAFSITRVSSLPGTLQSTQTIYRPWIRGESVTGAVWNDYAEYRESDCKDFGYVLMEKGDDTLTKTNERLSHFAGISSDTWGFSQGETENAKTPIAVAGRVLVYTYQDRSKYQPGDCVCAAPGGTIDIMTREEVIQYPDRIVGTVSCVPNYEEWGGGDGADRDPVKVNNRIWIKVR